MYATATYAAAAAASTAARRPLVAKLVSDPAFERARRYGLHDGTVEEFQHARGRAVRALKAARTRALRRAEAIAVPSAYLAGIAVRWGLDERRVLVLPNPAPEVGRDSQPQTPAERGRFVFAGRLTPQKGVRTALSALALVPDARLEIVGDGPERSELEAQAAAERLNGRVRFLGARPRDDVLELLAAADAAVLPSEWENFPHAAVEALSLGTPVVATAAGGVPEVVRDGDNGLLVPPGSPEALAAALRRLLDDRELRDGLASRARASVEPLSRDRIYGELAALLERAAAAG